MRRKGSFKLRPLVITIDGPAGVGKSTVSKCLADRFHYGYLDTGASVSRPGLESSKRATRPQ